jgi:hypothetical protein
MSSTAIRPIVTVGTKIIKDMKGFSCKHRAWYFQYVTGRDRLLNRIAQVRADHELDQDKEFSGWLYFYAIHSWISGTICADHELDQDKEVSGWLCFYAIHSWISGTICADLGMAH